MKLLSRITLAVPAGTAAIELLQGDLSALPKEHEADILVISAFPNDYTPLPGSLMYALHEKGLNVAELAANKSVDMVKNLGCWLSAPLSATQQQQFNIRHILCFEPGREAGTPDQVVGNIFRCINNFAFDDDNNVIAMQVLATGRQKMPADKMLPAMLEAAIFWLESGIPLDCIKLVVHGNELVPKALAVFNEAKKQHDPEPLPPQAEPVAGKAIAPPAAAAQTVSYQQEAKEYDVFISYSHQQSQPVAELVKTLQEKNPTWNIFYDRSSIPTGGLWIKVISDAIQRSKQVVCILTPGYRDSSVCWDEFQCAKAKEYRTKKPVIKTINFLKDADMPLIMSIYSYIDCTEGDVEKLKEAASALV